MQRKKADTNVCNCCQKRFLPALGGSRFVLRGLTFNCCHLQFLYKMEFLTWAGSECCNIADFTYIHCYSQIQSLLFVSQGFFVVWFWLWWWFVLFSFPNLACSQYFLEATSTVFQLTLVSCWLHLLKLQPVFSVSARYMFSADSISSVKFI